MASSSEKAEFRSALTEFFKTTTERLERFHATQSDREQREAPRFNVFAYIDPDENKLSDVISDLLDGSGQHGQGDLFLNSFLELVGVTPEIARPPFRMKREDLTLYCNSFNRRIDITLATDDFGIGIENKPWAEEGEDQLKDYMVHLSRKYGDRFLLVYLSGDGSSPASLGKATLAALESAGRLKTLAYPTHVLEWLKQCLHDCNAEKVRWFLQDLIDFVDDSFELVEAGQEETNEGE